MPKIQGAVSGYFSSLYSKLYIKIEKYYTGI